MARASSSPTCRLSSGIGSSKVAQRKPSPSPCERPHRNEPRTTISPPDQVESSENAVRGRASRGVRPADKSAMAAVLWQPLHTARWPDITAQRRSVSASTRRFRFLSASTLLLRQPLLLRRARRFRRPTLLRNVQRVPNQRREPLVRRLPVLLLAPMIARDDPDHPFRIQPRRQLAS